MNNGDPVTKELWYERKRELIDCLSRNLYGYTPPKPSYVRAVPTGTDGFSSFGGKATAELIDIRFDTPKGEFSFPIRVIIPVSVKKPPVILLISFGNRAPVPAEEILDNGFALVQFHHHTVEHDENRPDDYFGSSYPVGLLFERSLKFSGYDYEYRYFPNEGHCCRLRDYESQIGFMRFLWKDSLTKPITLVGRSKRIADLTGENGSWVPSEALKFPDRRSLSRYEAIGGEIYLIKDSGEKVKVADGFGSISALATSADKWRLYIACSDRRYIYAMSICEDGMLKDLCKLGTLHIDKDSRTIGAYDMTVDSNDRLYIATDMGVQCMTSYGIVDIILPLPEDVPANSVTLCGHELYARSSENTLVRTICAEELKDDGQTVILKHTGYYD